MTFGFFAGWRLGVVLVVVLVGRWCLGDFKTDLRYVEHDRAVSPGGDHVLVVYGYYTGAFGYTMPRFALVPTGMEWWDLSAYTLPPHYRVTRWLGPGVVEVEWMTAYGEEPANGISTGDVFHGVRVVYTGATR